LALPRAASSGDSCEWDSGNGGVALVCREAAAAVEAGVVGVLGAVDLAGSTRSNPLDNLGLRGVDGRGGTCWDGDPDADAVVPNRGIDILRVRGKPDAADGVVPADLGAGAEEAETLGLIAPALQRAGTAGDIAGGRARRREAGVGVETDGGAMGDPVVVGTAAAPAVVPRCGIAERTPGVRAGDPFGFAMVGC
jgi:hypothetical protein